MFKSVVPNPQVAVTYTRQRAADPKLSVGRPHGEAGYQLQVLELSDVRQARRLAAAGADRTDDAHRKEFDQGHGVWFNRGAIPSQAFAREFGNQRAPHPEDPNDKETAWLSRGLLEACLAFINGTPKGDSLRVAACEFTYKPILDALRSALDRGVDLKIVYHDTPDKKGQPNETAMKPSRLPINDRRSHLSPLQDENPAQQVHRPPHGPRAEPGVWTGSTNFTDSGFLGQTNVS